MIGSAAEAVSSQLERGFNIPTSILDQGILSNTNLAHECFVNQAFSNKLQAFMIDYVLTTSGYYSIYVN